MSDVLTMQDALLALTRYWAERGCIVTQPMNTEVGAGTLNPATFLRVLGPEPWRVAYVEPSVRPDDSRYGENPNRIQTHTQFQVILKPEPGDAQDLYLGSLLALGVNVGAHDLRFVEDNWASPALGAWGLGWEVWLDGLEITQFTYFQQAGGLALDPVSVELTYGIERIMMALQGAAHFKEIVYAPGITYGEAFGQAEYEMSRYYLDDADVETNRSLFESYASEARRLLDVGLSVPAHSYVLKCSHAFNVLDSRGAISTTERARAFARMRTLAREVGELWVARREELGHPLGRSEPPVPQAGPVVGVPAERPEGPATLAFELGVEEMPPHEVVRTADAVLISLRQRLAATGLEHGEVSVFGAPRRVVAIVRDVAPREADQVRVVRGPRVTAAFGADGQPTGAALGFARSQATEVDGLARVVVDGVEYVCVHQQVGGRDALDVLAVVLTETVAGLRAEKNMRWNAPGLAFTRPVRWLLGLLGEVIVPFSISSLRSGRVTRLHRSAVGSTAEVSSADALLDVLADGGIVVDPAARHRIILDGATALAATVGGFVDPATDGAVLDEVVNLVEGPTPILGSFDERYLELPSDILVTVMRRHQRYLPVRSDDGHLLPHFVAVANGDCALDVVRAGNEAVLRARYEDAAFFWRADLATTPTELRTRLGALTFEERLGSMADRADRIATIAATLAALVDLDEAERSTLARGATLAKFDLASQMVVELSSLAGTMGREYARAAGEPEAVALALHEMELPRASGGDLPVSLPGAILALADRFDLLAGLFALRAAPTGSSDPFGLRRAALGVLGILRHHPRLVDVTINAGLAAAGGAQPVPWSEDDLAAPADFVVARFEQQLIDAGSDPRLVRAVLPFADAPRHLDARLADLTRWAGEAGFKAVCEAMQRIGRIVPPGTGAAYDAGRLAEPAELALHETVSRIRTSHGALALGDLMAEAIPLTEAVDRFFTDILVLVDDPDIRERRLGLLAAVLQLGSGVADWAALD